MLGEYLYSMFPSSQKSSDNSAVVDPDVDIFASNLLMLPYSLHTQSWLTSSATEDFAMILPGKG